MLDPIGAETPKPPSATTKDVVAPKVLTEAKPIPDVTPKVEELAKDVAEIKAEPVGNVTQKEHDVVQADIEKNKEAIKTNTDKNIKQDKTTDEIRQELEEEMERNRLAIAALQVDGDVLKKRYSLVQPLPPKTTAQEDLTVDVQRKLAIISGYSQSIISIMVTLATVSISIFMVVTNSQAEFPTVLAAAQGAVIIFFFQRVATVVGTVTANVEK